MAAEKPAALYKVFSRERLDNRQIDELLGLSHGIIADGIVNQKEVEYLQKWLVANADVSNNPVIATLYNRVGFILQDGNLDSEEAKELFETLAKFTGSADWELGEIQKSSTLPLDIPLPNIVFSGKRFCFTGTFSFGTRTDCEQAVIERGAQAGGLTTKTDYLVIGSYATESWAHSSYGRKIEKGVEMKREGSSISIIHESHWANFLNSAA